MTDKSIITAMDSVPDKGVLPDLCDVKNLFVTVLLTIVLAIIFSLASSASLETFWDQLSLSVLLMLWIALVNAALLCQLRSRLHAMTTRRCLAIVFAIMMLVSLGVATGVVLVDAQIRPAFNFIDHDSSGLFVIRTMVISAVIYFIVLRYFYIQHQWQLQVLSRSSAQVEALRARIRPHFLFNSMNTIASLVQLDPDKAEKAVEDLSDLFRASLGEHNLNPVSQEISLTRSYLDIEKLRLGDRLDVHWNTEPDILDIPVPALCLQPLAENAIYHGIEPLEKGGKILISLLNKGGELEISVSNPLSATGAMHNRKGNQMAQDNIRQRLKLVYGASAGFSINDTKENYTVTIIIPLGVNDERSNRR